MEKTIKIHREIPLMIANDTLVLKSMSVFYSLKFLYVGGIIKDIVSRYGEVAGMIGISQSNLRTKVKHLTQMGLLRREGRNIVFSNYNDTGKRFGTRSKKSFRVLHKGAKEMETVLKALALESNLEKQRHKLKERITKEELKRYGKIEAKSIRRKIEKYIRKNISLYAEKHYKRVSKTPGNPFSENRINPDISLSRNGIAEMVGRVSKSTGSRLVSKMKTMGLLESDEKRVERICRCGSDAVLRHMDLDSSFFVFKGSLYKRKTNLLSLRKFFA